jgi:large subunit ribosomal protein L7/L12
MFRVRQVASNAVRRFATTGTPSVASICNTKIPASSLDEKPVSVELESLVERLCTLDLIQTAQVVSLLKKRLNLPDIIAAPMNNMNTAASTATATTAPSTPVVEKTEFRVTLEKFDTASKAKIIREIKTLLPTLNLVEAKAFVEGAPKLIKEKVKKEEAEKIKKTLEELGATITLD